MKKILSILIVMTLLVGGGFFGYRLYKEKTKELDITELNQLLIISDDKIVTSSLSTEAYEILSTKKYIPETALKALGFLMSYDERENMISLVSYDTLMRYDMKQNILFYDGEEYQMENPPKQVEGQFYFAEEDFGEGANLGWYINDHRKVLMALDNKSDYTKSIVGEKTKLLKEKNNEDSGILAKLEPQSAVFLGQTQDGWIEVVTDQLIHGYIQENKLGETKVYQTIMKPKKEFVYTDTPINLTWEAVYSRNPDTSKIPEMKGLNVISPTWMSLADSEGNINKKLISKNYTKWAKGRGYEVWPLISNDFKPDRTSEFLKSTAARQHFIEQLVDISIANNFDGINIDFENVYLEDKDRLSQFVAELSQQLRQNDITVSMDVTVIGGSDNWSRCYDRKVLGEYLDYLMIMAYDQYWAASPVSGPVAAYDWVSKKMDEITDIVPAHKVVLGMPTYMRLWKETPSLEKANAMKAKSETLSMNRLVRLMDTNDFNFIWDEAGQHYYIGYIKDNVLVKIWVENGKSIRAKTAYARENNLAGVATWRRGFETQDIWGIIEEELNK